jgi:hypothetical protein
VHQFVVALANHILRHKQQSREPVTRAFHNRASGRICVEEKEPVFGGYTAAEKVMADLVREREPPTRQWLDVGIVYCNDWRSVGKTQIDAVYLLDEVALMHIDAEPFGNQIEIDRWLKRQRLPRFVCVKLRFILKMEH